MSSDCNRRLFFAAICQFLTGISWDDSSSRRRRQAAKILQISCVHFSRAMRAKTERNNPRPSPLSRLQIEGCATVRWKAISRRRLHKWIRAEPKSSNLTAAAPIGSLISATVVHLGSIRQKRDLMNLKEEYVLGAAGGACGLFKVN